MLKQMRYGSRKAQQVSLLLAKNRKQSLQFTDSQQLMSLALPWLVENNIMSCKVICITRGMAVLKRCFEAFHAEFSCFYDIMARYPSFKASVL